MSSITQLGFDGVAPDAPASTSTYTPRVAAAQKRYRKSERGKAKQREHLRAYRERHGEVYREQNRVRSRNATRLKLYGITVEAYEAMLTEQCGACAICEGPPGSRDFHVDHDHTTGKVRAILCADCNHMLGRSHDSPAILRTAADYLERHGK